MQLNYGGYTFEIPGEVTQYHPAKEVDAIEKILPGIPLRIYPWVLVCDEIAFGVITSIHGQEGCYGFFDESRNRVYVKQDDNEPRFLHNKLHEVAHPYFSQNSVARRQLSNERNYAVKPEFIRRAAKFYEGFLNGNPDENEGKYVKDTECFYYRYIASLLLHSTSQVFAELLAKEAYRSFGIGEDQYCHLDYPYGVLDMPSLKEAIDTCENPCDMTKILDFHVKVLQLPSGLVRELRTHQTDDEVLRKLLGLSLEGLYDVFYNGPRFLPLQTVQ